jgi:hypothetical protein
MYLAGFVSAAATVAIATRDVPGDRDDVANMSASAMFHVEQSCLHRAMSIT